MKNYQFSMSKILDLRVLKEEEAKKEFGIVKQTQQKHQAKLATILSEKKNLAHGSQNITEMRLTHLYQNHLEELIQLEEEQIQVIEQEVAVKLGVLVSAQKERKILEKLEEKHYELFLDESKKAEQKMLDDMGTLRFGAARY